MSIGAAGDEQQAIQVLNEILAQYEQNETGQVVSVDLAQGASLFGEQLTSRQVRELLAQLPSLREVRLTGGQIDDGVMEQIGHFSELQILKLRDTHGLTLDGLGQLLNCRQLQELTLRNCQLTDSALVVIGQLTSLRDLSCGYNAFTGAGIRHLSGLSNLTTLYMRKCQLAGHDLDALVGLPLETLGLAESSLDDASLRCLGKLKHLRSLHIRGAKITDESLSALEDLPLTDLGLVNATLTDRGMEALGRIRSLESLWIAGTAVTEASVDDLLQLEKLKVLMVPGSFTPSGRDRLLKARPLLSLVGDWNMSSWLSIAAINTALLDFHKTLQGFPATAGVNEAGEARLSWRVAILPFIDEKELFDKFRFDEPWDSEHNLALLPMMPAVFRDHMRPTPEGYTVFQAAIGEETLLQEREPSNLQQATDAGGTILLVQTTSHAAVPWTAPRDYQYDPANPKRDLVQNRMILVSASQERSGYTFLEDVDKAILKALFTRSGGD
jgi:hypothetical protein